MDREVVTRIKLDTSTVAPAAAQASQAIGGIARAGEMSARQTAAAMRMLPAQFTDVATQLAGGQNPLLILLQQGGQVRDQFGSIGAALRGVGSFITPFNVAVGGAALVVGALGKAYSDVSDEQQNIVRGLVLTGNAAGVTAGHVQDLARAQDEIVGTRAQAVEALTQLATTGTVLGSSLKAAAEAAVRLQLAGGPAIEETVKKFADLGRKPLEAIAKLTREEGAFTESVIRQVAELLRQGRELEAVSLAQEAYAKTIITRSGDIERSLGGLARGWNWVKSAAREAWDAVLDVGREETTQQKLDALTARLSAQRGALGGGRIAKGGFGALGRQQFEQDRQRQAELQEMLRLEGRSATLQAEGVARARKAAEEEEERLRKLRERKGRGIPGNAIEDAELAIQRRIEQWAERNQEVLDRLQASDPLGDFVIERVLPADKQRAEQRLDQQEAFLHQLVDANAQANLALIADDRQREVARIALERRATQRRIEAIFSDAGDRAAAGRLADERAEAQRREAWQHFSRDAALVTRKDVGDALAAAFRDSKNPIQAFGNALGSVVYQRLVGNVAAALADGLVGADGTGGLLGSLFGGGGGFLGDLFDGIFGGGRAGGGGVQRGRLYRVNEEEGPGELLQTRSGRTYLMAGQDGQVMPTRRRAAAAGGGEAPVTVNVYQTNNLGSDVSRAEVAAQLQISQRATQAAVFEALRRNRMGVA